MTDLLRVFIAVWLVMGVAGIGVGVKVAYDHLRGFVAHRRDVAWAKRQPWHTGSDETDPAFVKRLRADIVDAARQQGGAR